MQHIVTIWAGNFATDEEFMSYIAIVRDTNDERHASLFEQQSGLSDLDEDFMEAHYIRGPKERQEFIDYMRNDYSPHHAFTEHLPEGLEVLLAPYNSLILIYGNDSPHGAINECLLNLVEDPSSCASAASAAERISAIGPLGPALPGNAIEHEGDRMPLALLHAIRYETLD
ncbi:hypothetical protein D3C74_00260 [compost metagenome]